LGNGTLYEAVGEPQIVTLGFVETVSPIATSTAVRKLSTSLDITVTSDTAGTLYWMVIESDDTSPTLAQLVAQANYGDTPITPVGKGVDALTAGTGHTETVTVVGSTAYKVVYAVVGDSNISNLITVNVPATGTLTAMTGGSINATGGVITDPTTNIPAGTTLVYLTVSAGISTAATALGTINPGVTTVAQLITAIGGSPTFGTKPARILAASYSSKVFIILAVTGTGGTATVSSYQEIAIPSTVSED
jgi:hypothetical protein